MSEAWLYGYATGLRDGLRLYREALFGYDWIDYDLDAIEEFYS